MAGGLSDDHDNSDLSEDLGGNMTLPAMYVSNCIDGSNGRIRVVRVMEGWEVDVFANPYRESKLKMSPYQLLQLGKQLTVWAKEQITEELS